MFLNSCRADFGYAFSHYNILEPLGRESARIIIPSPSGRGPGRGYRKYMKSLARLLRSQMTDAERLLWHHLRARRLSGFRFRRQLVIEPYIVDFACLEVKLVVEADGGQH